MHISKLVLVLVLFVFSFSASAQTDSNVVKVDSSMRNPGTKPKRPEQKIEPKKPEVFKDSMRLALERLPKEAAYRSLFLPGLGQIYNKRPSMVKSRSVFRYWKVPVIYAGYTTIGIIYVSQQKYYKQMLKELQFRQAFPGETKDQELINLDFTTLVTYKDYYRRNRDLCYLSFILAHTVQVIDAYVDAKLFRYDVSDDLGFKLVPSLQVSPGMQTSFAAVPSLKLRVSF